MKRKLTVLYSDIQNIKYVAGLGFDYMDIKDWKPTPDADFLVIDQNAYHVIRDTINLGVRGSNFYNLTMLHRVGLNDGSNYIFTYPNQDNVNKHLEWYKDEHFYDPDPIVKDVPFSLITNLNEAISTLDYLTSLPLGTWFGYDFETNHFPNEKEFVITGLGIATLEHRYFIDYRFCMQNPKPTLLDLQKNNDIGLAKLMEAHKRFLDKHSKHCVVFNVNMELMCDYRYHDLFYEFRDLNVVNVMRRFGNWMNLKWTARYELNINSWDDKFDEFNNAFCKSDENNEYPLAKYDEWGNILQLNFKNIRKRFDWISLTDCMEMQDHFNVCPDTFYIMPTRWLGYYCSFDAYYTLLSWVKELPIWNWKETPDNHGHIGADLDKLPRMPIEDRFHLMAEAGLDVYSDGKIAETIVNNGGQMIDTHEWKFQNHWIWSVLLFTTTHLITFYYKRNITKLTNINKIEDYPKVVQRFIKDGIDVTAGGYELIKTLIIYRYHNERCQDELDTNLIYEDWGQGIGQKIIDTIWAYCDSMQGIHRKRKVFTEISYIIDPIIKLSDDILAKHADTIKYYELQHQLETINSVEWIHDDIYHMKEFYHINDKKVDTQNCTQYLLNNFCNINTMQNEILQLGKDLNPDYSLFIHARCCGLSEKITEHFNTGSLDKDIEFFFSDDAVKLFSDSDLKTIQTLYTQKVWEDPVGVHITYCAPVAYTAGAYPNDWKLIKEKFNNGILDEKYGYSEIILAIRLWAKAFKMSSYLSGTYYDTDNNYHTLDKYWMADYDLINGFTMDNPNVMCHPHFDANIQYSGRWSSNFHTIPSKSEIKKITTSPDDSIFTYFDISSKHTWTAA